MSRPSPAVETGAREASTTRVPSRTLAEQAWPRRELQEWRFALLRRLLACADVVAALVACLSFLFVGDGDGGQFVWSLVFLPFWVLVAKLLGLYDRDIRVLRHLTLDEVPQLALWALVGTVGVTLFLDLTPAGRPTSSSAVAAALVAGALVFLLRVLVRWLWRKVTPPERVAILGVPSAATAVKRKLELFPDAHMTVVSERDLHDVEDVGDPASLAGVDRLVFAPASFDEREFDTILESARASGVSLSLIPPARSAFGTAVQLNHLAELPFLEYRTSDLSRSTLFLKRAMDVAVSALALALLAPIFVLVAIAIKLDSRGPVLFRQVRSGQNGGPFRMLKFRTMVVDAEVLLAELVPFDKLADPVFKLSNDPRVTPVGRFLRRWSLDELPQLLNVLAGDMSLVGPRPEQVELVERYSDEQKRIRLALKPGLTGPMQVYGRGSLTLPERLAVERDYVENLSLGRDLRILGMTLAVVLGRRGAY